LKLLREHSRIGTKGKIMKIKFGDKFAIGVSIAGELLIDITVDGGNA